MHELPHALPFRHTLQQTRAAGGSAVGAVLCFDAMAAAVEILAARVADGDDPPVPIDVPLPARHPLAIDEQPQRPRRLGAAKPVHRVAVAGLPTLRRVDPVQPYPLAENHDRLCRQRGDPPQTGSGSAAVPASL